MLAEIGKLDRIRALGLPADLFAARDRPDRATLVREAMLGSK